MCTYVHIHEWLIPVHTTGLKLCFYKSCLWRACGAGEAPGVVCGCSASQNGGWPMLPEAGFTQAGGLQASKAMPNIQVHLLGHLLNSTYILFPKRLKTSTVNYYIIPENVKALQERWQTGREEFWRSWSCTNRSVNWRSRDMVAGPKTRNSEQRRKKNKKKHWKDVWRTTFELTCTDQTHTTLQSMPPGHSSLVFLNVPKFLTNISHILWVTCLSFRINTFSTDPENLTNSVSEVLMHSS